MEWIEWFFDGIGSAIVSLILGLVIGGVSGYKIGIRKSNEMNQKAGNNSKQTQIGVINSNRDGYTESGK